MARRVPFQLNSLTFRLLAGALVWCAIVLLVGGFVLANIVQNAFQRSLDDRLRVVTDNVLAVAQVSPDGTLSFKRPLTDNRFQRAYSGWYWQIDTLSDGADVIDSAPRSQRLGLRRKSWAPVQRKVAARSRSLWDEKLTLPNMPPKSGIVRAKITGPDQQDLRVLTLQTSLPGAEDPFQIIVAADMQDMKEDLAEFNNTLIWSLLILGSVLIVVLMVQIRIGLSPLARVRRALAGVRSGDTDRLTGDFPAEIAPLADELNKVLDHNRAVVERASTQVGNLAHALKTPLSVLSNAGHDKANPMAGLVREQTDNMRRQVERYLASARTVASATVLGARAPVGPVIEDIVRTLRKINEEHDIRVSVTCDRKLTFRGERADLEEIAGNLLDNAFKWAQGNVEVVASREKSFLRLVVRDDGPGLTPEEREEAVKRGRRLDESVPGSGLGLSIVGDIVEAYHGAFELARAPQGGLEARVTLPRA